MPINTIISCFYGAFPGYRDALATYITSLYPILDIANHDILQRLIAEPPCGLHPLAGMSAAGTATVHRPAGNVDWLGWPRFSLPFSDSTTAITATFSTAPLMDDNSANLVDAGQSLRKPLLHRLGAQGHGLDGAGRVQAMQSGVGVRHTYGLSTHHPVGGVHPAGQRDPQADHYRQRFPQPTHSWLSQVPNDGNPSRAPRTLGQLVSRPLAEHLGGRHRGEVGIDEVALQRAVAHHRPGQRHPPFPLEPLQRPLSGLRRDHGLAVPGGQPGHWRGRRGLPVSGLPVLQPVGRRSCRTSRPGRRQP